MAQGASSEGDGVGVGGAWDLPGPLPGTRLKGADTRKQILTSIALCGASCSINSFCCLPLSWKGSRSAPPYWSEESRGIFLSSLGFYYKQAEPRKSGLVNNSSKGPGPLNLYRMSLVLKEALPIPVAINALGRQLDLGQMCPFLEGLLVFGLEAWSSGSVSSRFLVFSA